MTAWLFGCAYVLAATGCLLRGLQRGERGWHAGAAILCLLALVQVARLDLSSTGLVRAWVLGQGWYEWRRPVQGAALAAGGAALGLGAWRLRQRPLLAAGLGSCLLLAWTRVVSLHQVDALLGARLGWASVGRWLDALALGAVLAACLRSGGPRA